MVGFKEEDDRSRPDIFNRKFKIESFLDPEASVLGEINRTKGFIQSHRTFPQGCPLDNDTMIIGMANALTSSGEEKLGFSWTTSWDFGFFPFYVCPYDPNMNIYDLVYDSFDSILNIYHDLYDMLPTRYFFYRDVSQGSVNATRIEAELAAVKDSDLYKRYEWGYGKSKCDFMVFRSNAPFEQNDSNFMLGKNYFTVKSDICTFQPCPCGGMRKALTIDISDYDSTPIVSKMAKEFAAKKAYD